MDPNTILTKILRRYGVLTEDIRSMQIVESKIKNRIATYADAEDAAIKIGKALRTALSENLPDALTDGRLYRAVAEVVLEQPMKAAGKDVAEITSAIQKELNEEAGLGMNPVVPEMNQDQIDGIVTGICNADSYEAGKDVMLDQVENCLEGYVDDFVQENADFQYKAGLSPTIERKISGKCCEWCAKLAGSYPYEDVSDRGNDVFRRHRNCHCLIMYNPGNGSRRRQNVHSREFGTEEELRERQLHYGEKRDFSRDSGPVKARKIENYRGNNLYIDQNVNLSPKDIRRINTQITQAKELHGIVGQCNAPFVIVNDSKKLAAYNPRTNEFYISSRLADEKNLKKLQQDYVRPNDPRSTVVHELFHWKDAEEYRNNIGTIKSASRTSEYSVYQREKARSGLFSAGVDLSDEKDCYRISKYAGDKYLENDLEEVYTELRTKQLFEGGAK